MKSNPRLIVIGFTNIDLTVMPGAEPTISHGGAGYFAALAASLLHTPVGFVTRIGNDFDASFLSSHVLPEGIVRSPGKPTSRSIQTYLSAEDLSRRDIRLESGASDDLIPEDIPSAWLPTAAIVHIGTMPPTQQGRILHHLRTHAPNARISIDTDQFLLKDDVSIQQISALFREADIVFANRIEYGILKAELDMHPFCVSKLDREGARILKRGRIVAHADVSPVQPVDATGAGDIFAGTFLAGLMEGNPPEQCLQDAAAQATRSVTAVGLMHLFPDTHGA